VPGSLPALPPQVETELTPRTRAALALVWCAYADAANRLAEGDRPAPPVFKMVEWDATVMKEEPPPTPRLTARRAGRPRSMTQFEEVSLLLTVFEEIRAAQPTPISVRTAIRNILQQKYPKHPSFLLNAETTKWEKIFSRLRRKIIKSGSRSR
jgi:hypothetical protein